MSNVIVGSRIGKESQYPEEILKQTKVFERNPNAIDDKVLSVIEDLQGTATVDEIFLNYFIKYKDKNIKKHTIRNSLGRMEGAGILSRVSKRGAYFIPEEAQGETGGTSLPVESQPVQGIPAEVTPPVGEVPFE